ncbi:MAG: zinc metalloprotease [Cyclobacteriaceae bacterium]
MSSSFRASEMDFDQIVTIPVVVHIVYSNPIQNISDDQVFSQLEALNKDFRKSNTNSSRTISEFVDRAADTKINFVLVSQDESNFPFLGITRTSTDHGPFFDDDIHYSVKGGKDAWGTREKLNIWVCDLPDGIFGYGSPPGSSEDMDGLVIDYQYFGTIGTVKPPYHLGRTVTHEVGHWLGLNHLWGVSFGCEFDDGIEDTPLQQGPNSECDLTSSSCGSLDMIQNFMSESDDFCMTLFTEGQKKRMRKNLFESRYELVRDVVSASDPMLLTENPNITTISNYELQVLSGKRITHTSVYSITGRNISHCIDEIKDNEYQLTLNNYEAVVIVVITSGNQQYSFKIRM